MYSLGVVDYVVIGMMLAVSASVGLYFRFTGGRQRTTHEFLMAGKNMSIGPVAFSLMATYMSAISVLGQPAETYMYGSQYIMWMIGMPCGGVMAAYGFLPVFFDMEISTVYEYLETRFGKTTRTVSSLLFILQMIFYMTVVLYAPSLALNAVTGLSTWASVVSLAAVCTFYCSLGGLKSVLWTDVFQSVLMYTTILAVVVKGSMVVGGVENVFTTANKGGRLVFFNMSADFTERYTFMNAVAAGFIFSISTFGTNQIQVQRMLSVGNLKKAQKALLWSLPLILFFNMLCVWDGIVIYSNFHDCDPLLNPEVKLNSADQLMPHSILQFFGGIPGLPGLCIAGIFSASLSTVSSAVNSLTAVTMEDFIRPFCFCKRLTESWAAFLAKIIAIVYGGICLLLTLVVSNFRGVLEASTVLAGMVGGPTLGIYILGLFTTTANEPGALIGLLVGFSINAWLGFGSYAAKIKIPTLTRSTEGCATIDNGTLDFPTNLNVTMIFDIGMENITVTPKLTDETHSVPQIYKISYVWFAVIGASMVIIVGYLASVIIGIWKKYPVLAPVYFSPFVRKCLFNSSKIPFKGTEYRELEVKTNGCKDLPLNTNCFSISEASHT